MIKLLFEGECKAPDNTEYKTWVEALPDGSVSIEQSNGAGSSDVVVLSPEAVQTVLDHFNTEGK